ncbi:MAG: methylenetetrahydrofolate--tRNA-(uracil(54)-C(5))-methyltransferase (FADH(2)-oxidizing) TrmFO [Ruminiclostridium sp.]|nr:methylenetetrahydrofolate--tRNA-(uracil(54)-C(5))-methyltransferase (FADH(2)-oxidizing) TrmFO [Ruminiclostridium sp.]
MERINVIGAGLAGCEAAWQIAQRGGKVSLYEMKPGKKSPAHHLDTYAELVCSNSLRSNQLENAVGLLKEELRRMGSLVLLCADENAVPAGGALAVDRKSFSECVTAKIKNHPNIQVIHQEVTAINPDQFTIIATGPLTSDALSEEIADIIGHEALSFFDAAAPIVKAETINMNKAFSASRYEKGADDYINCPLSRDEYLKFYQALVTAEPAPVKDFEQKLIFEGCMPIEIMAQRGVDTLRYGPMKPVGLTNPHTGTEPYSVVQLRQDNREGTLYNLVGFQTHLKWPEQKRVFSMIPGLEEAEFARYGVMHRNTFINSPKLLTPVYRFRKRNNLFFAGQITGVEGYVESAASGLVAGINAFRAAMGSGELVFPNSTAIGALAYYVSTSSMGHFEPMNINYGIMTTDSGGPEQAKGRRGRAAMHQNKREKYLRTANKSLEIVESLKDK